MAQGGSIGSALVHAGRRVGIIVAITGWLATTIAALFAYLRFRSDAAAAAKGAAPDNVAWILTGAAVVLAAVALGATAKLLKDLRDARK